MKGLVPSLSNVDPLPDFSSGPSLRSDFRIGPGLQPVTQALVLLDVWDAFRDMLTWQMFSRDRRKKEGGVCISQVEGSEERV